MYCLITVLLLPFLSRSCLFADIIIRFFKGLLQLPCIFTNRFLFEFSSSIHQFYWQLSLLDRICLRPSGTVVSIYMSLLQYFQSMGLGCPQQQFAWGIQQLNVAVGPSFLALPFCWWHRSGMPIVTQPVKPFLQTVQVFFLTPVDPECISDKTSSRRLKGYH